MIAQNSPYALLSCGANVVHLRQKKIGKWMMINHLPMLKVIRLGLEPKTPSLKGMCSTC